MLLAFDVGNTNTVIGVFKDRILINNWRIETDIHKSADEYGMLLKQFFDYEKISMDSIDDIIVSTVVPSVLFTLQHMAIKYFGKKPIVVESGIKTGLVIKYDNPKQVGADRIVNAVGALNKYGGPLIIIDFGTATTFCAVSHKGEYLGGTIAPGIKISSDALFEKTSKLPRVEIEPPGKTICKNTAESVQAGLVYGHMGTCDYIIKKMKEELRDYCGDMDVTVVATGGMSGLIESGIDSVDHVDKFLTLNGLEIIYEKNRNI